MLSARSGVCTMVLINVIQAQTTQWLRVRDQANVRPKRKGLCNHRYYATQMNSVSVVSTPDRNRVSSVAVHKVRKMCKVVTCEVHYTHA